MVSRATLVGSRVTRGGVACALLLATSLGAGCAAEDTPAEPRRPDRASFEATIYPVLLRDCGFVACHGDGGRAFRVVGPGRTRLDPLDALDAPPTAAELDATFERTVSMLATPRRRATRCSCASPSTRPRVARRIGASIASGATSTPRARTRHGRRSRPGSRRRGRSRHERPT
jgi:hypothetical protein